MTSTNSFEKAAHVCVVQDKKSVESCCQCFSRLVESFSSNRVVLKLVVTTALLQNLQQLVSMCVSPLFFPLGREVPYSVL